MVTDSERAAACRALLARERGEGPSLPSVVVAAAESLCGCEDLTEERTAKLANLRGVFSDNPAVLAYLGGPKRSAVAQTVQTELEMIDVELRAEIIGIAEQALADAAEAVEVEVKPRIERSRLSPGERYSLDNDPFDVFFYETLRAPARAALTPDEDTIARRRADRAAPLVESVLERGAALILAALGSTNADTTSLGGLLDDERPRAVDLFRTALTAMIVGRLGRATERDRVLRDARVPEGVATDTLEVAGGAGSSNAGGLVRDQGRVLRPDGTYRAGANMAQGHHVSVELVQAEQVEAVRVFRHSGKQDARSEHRSASGRTEDELGGRVFPGQHPDCGCRWRIEYR